MNLTLRDRLTALFREVRYHPDFAHEKRESAKRLVKGLVKENKGRAVDISRLALEGNEKANEIKQLIFDSLLMGDYLEARIRFLEHVIACVSEKGPELKIADDGCGSGVDIYCLRQILSGEVTIVGIDPNEGALAMARSRNECINFYTSLSGKLFDIIYSDFFDIGKNLLEDIYRKGREYARALCPGGMLIQNIDQDDSSRGLLISMMGGRLKLLREELIGEIPNHPDCYLLVWQKREV